MRILVISPNDAFRQPAQAACLRFTESLVSLRLADSLGQGLELAHQFEAEVVIVDLTRNVEAGLIAIGDLAAAKMTRLVVASVDKSTTDLMTRAIRAGAGEFIAQPPQEDEIHAVLRKAQRMLSPVEMPENRRGRIVVAFSSKGGVGKTTLTCNLALLLAQKYGAGRVALIDANTQAPNVAPMLDLRPERWLRDAVEEYRRLDGEMLSQIMTPHPSGLMVLAHSADNPLGLDFDEDQLSKILLVAKANFDFVLVDTFPLLSSLNLALLDLSDQIMLVTEAVVPALRSARYNLQVLRQAGYGPGRILLVLNRFTRFRGNVPVELAQETLDWPIETVLPYDVHATIAANNGKGIVEMFPDSKLSQQIVELGGLISGESATTSRPRASLGERLMVFLRGY
jgi:pilus assembly protein CpaE